MIERIQKAAFLLEIICCFGLFYGILCTAMYSFIPDHRLCMAALVLILPFIGSAFGARHLKNVIFFAGYHLIQAILCWLIAPNLQLALILVIYTAAVFIFFFFKKTAPVTNRRFFGGIRLHLWDLLHFVGYIPAVGT